MTVLGIDPGLIVTGWALLTEGAGLIAHGRWRHQQGTDLERRAAYCDDLRALIGVYLPGLVVVEDQYASAGRGNSILKLAALRGALVREAQAAGVEVLEVQPAVGKEALAFGGARKPAMVAHANGRFGLALKDSEADVADALGLALVGVAVLTRPTQAAMAW